MKIPTIGETVLVFDECTTYQQYEDYRKKVLASGGRIRRAVDNGALQRHLAIYAPTFIIHLKDRSQNGKA